MLTMDKSRDGNHSSKEFTEVINRNIKVGHEKDYDERLRRFMKLESEVPGYLGTTIIAPLAVVRLSGTLLTASPISPP